MQKNPDFALSQIVISLANDDLRLNQRDRPVRITPGVDFHFKNGSLCSAGVRPEMSASGLLECPPARMSHSALRELHLDQGLSQSKLRGPALAPAPRPGSTGR